MSDSPHTERPLRMLLLEDDEDDAKLLQVALRKSGLAHEIKCVGGRADFVASLSQYRPDLILSDYKLRDVNGLEALSLARQQCPDTPFILITGALGEELAVEVMKEGATDYILKDRIYRLVPAIQRALREVEHRDQRRHAEDLLRKQHEQLKRQNEELLASEARFRQLAENIREVFWMTDVRKSQMLYVSPEYETIWGRTCQSLYDSPRGWVDAIHEPDRERVLESALTRQASGDYDEEYRIVRPDGRSRWIHDRAFPIRTKEGEVYRIVGIAEDITERKLAEQRLEARNAVVRTLAESGSLADAAPAILRTIAECLEWEVGVVWEVSADENLLRSVGWSCAATELGPLAERVRSKTLRKGEDLPGMAWSSGEHVCSLDIGADVRFTRGTVPESYGAIAFPIQLGSDMAGVLEFFGRRMRPPDKGTLELVGPLAAQIAQFMRRKQAEMRAATLAQAVESTGEMICITDMNDRFTFVNRAFLKAYGYNEAEILGKTPEMLFSRQNPPGLIADILEGTRAGSWHGEVIDRRKDGTEFPVLLSTSQVRTRQGEVIGLMGIAQDITKRKQAEERIRLLADAMQSTHDLIYITDPQNRIVFVNRAFLDGYGYTENEVLGRTSNFLYPSKMPSVLSEEIFRKGLAGGWEGEVVNCKKDGSEFPISLSTSAITDHKGNLLNLVCVARDISGRKRAEKQREAFSALGYRLNSAIAAEDAAHVILDIALELFGWDAAYVHLYSREEDKIVPVLTFDTLGGRRISVDAETFTLDPSPLMRLVMSEGARLINRENQTPTPVAFVPFGDASTPSASMMYVPIHFAGTALGILSIQSYTAEAYSHEDLQLLQALADDCGDALQRIKVAEALREADTKYQSIFENASEGIFQTTPDGRYLHANPALARMFGYASPAELIASISNIEAQTFVSPEDAGKLKKLLETQGAAVGFEAERFRKDGSKYWTSINVRGVRDERGKVRYYEGTVQDVTNRKRAEVVLRESEEKFRALFESAPIAIGLHDRRGKLIQTNQAYQRMLGYSNAELLRLGVRKITHPADVAEGQRLFTELRDGIRDRYEREKRFLRKDGEIAWAQSSASALRDANGELSYIISMLEDISERKKAVEALRQSERNLRLIAENTTDVIFCFDMQREPVYVNPAIEELTGYTFAEIKHQKFINWIHPEDHARMIKLWDSLYEGNNYADVEFRLITKNGEVKWCSSTWGPLLDENGHQIGVQGRERDITERKELERVVLETSANERRRVGHELHDGLGQYLAGIAFKAKALEEALAAQKVAHAREAKELAGLVSNAISQTRSLARGLDPVEVETIGLAAALQNLAAEANRFFNISCRFRCAESAGKIDGQTALPLYRIVQEAIHNAITHGEATEVEIELGRNSDHAYLRIRDNGQGFLVEDQLQTGMGLRVMQYRANSVGGALKVQSEPGRGTSIYCQLPGSRLVLSPVGVKVHNSVSQPDTSPA